jgi:DNA primase
LTWAEVDAGVDRRDFTVRTMPERVRAVGDLWSVLRESPGADLAAILRAAPARNARATRVSPSGRRPVARRR